MQAANVAEQEQVHGKQGNVAVQRYGVALVD